MHISGFIKQSLIDYPGQIASVVFTQGCNFRCPYCHNRQLIPMDKGTIPVSEVLDYFRKNKLLLDAVVITGGEPTLHKDLPEFILAIKQQGLNVKLDTNGSNPEVLSQLQGSHLIDYVAMDVKSELLEEAYSRAGGVSFTSEKLGRIRQSIQLLIRPGISHEFRTTVCRELVSLENIRAIVFELDGTQQYYLQQYHPYSELCGNDLSFSAYPEEEMRDFIKNLVSKFSVSLRK